MKKRKRKGKDYETMDGFAFCRRAGGRDADGVRKAIAGTADKVDYVVWLDADTLEEPTENTREILVAVAAYFGTTRLIDNVLIQEKK